MAVKKKKVVKKNKPVKVDAPKQIAITLNNVVPYMVSTLNTLERKIDRLQKTVDAVGFAVVENK